MQRIRLISSLAAVALTVAACSSDSSATSAAAPASSSAAPTTTTAPPGKELHATATSTEPPAIGEPICDAQQHCMYPLTNKNTAVSGDLTGTSVSHGAGALFGDKFGAGDTLIFTGTVAGCGTGTMVLLGTGVGSMTSKTVADWIVAEGIGDGDLVRVKGSGTTTSEPQPDGLLKSSIVARLSCD